MQGLKAVLRASVGYGASTTLQEGLLAQLGVSDPKELITWIYDEKRQNRAVAELAGTVLSAASSGDKVAKTIVSRGVQHLYRYYRNITERLKMQEAPVSFAGGLLSGDTLLQRLLKDKIGEELFVSAKYAPIF